MSADILTMRLPVAMTAPGSALQARPPILPPDAQLRLGVHQASKLLAPFVPSEHANLKRIARVAATAIAVNAPQDWTIADLVDWLTSTAPQADAE